MEEKEMEEKERTADTGVRKRPKVGEHLELKIEGLAFGGSGVTRAGSGVVVFVHGAVPGDRVEAVVTKRRREWIEARTERLIESSEDRVAPRCAHFGNTGGLCGGCKWQNFDYGTQLRWKERQVADHLQRIGGIASPPVEPIIGMERPWEYRNKMEYSFGTFADGRLKLGLHAAGSFERIIHIDHCHLQTCKCNELRNEALEFCRSRELSGHSIRRHEGLLRHLVVRTGGNDLMACIVTFGDGFEPDAADFAETLTSKFPELKSLFWYSNVSMGNATLDGARRLLAGDSHITEEMAGVKLRISPEAFAQTNPEQ
ncbi:MAG TPA: TRAM domain-containing protein, partial [bacterium]|nr:TRAM domain-containing protein [bacterium]